MKFSKQKSNDCCNEYFYFRQKLKQSWTKRFKEEGLNTLTYTIVQTNVLDLFTRFLVQPPPPPQKLYSDHVEKTGQYIIIGGSRDWKQWIYDGPQGEYDVNKVILERY